MRVLDLFSGTGSATQPFIDRGHEVVTVDNDSSFHPDIVMDLYYAEPEDFPGPWDFIWASPPCTCFSVASIGTHWTGGRRAYEPRTCEAQQAIRLVDHTVVLCCCLKPKAWLMENPRGVLRKLEAVSWLPRHTVTYCQYGDTRMKPTDLWGYPPTGWHPRPMCHNGDPCHERAPRGAKTGTQGLANAKERGRVPYELGLELCLAVELCVAREVVEVMAS